MTALKELDINKLIVDAIFSRTSSEYLLAKVEASLAEDESRIQKSIKEQISFISYNKDTYRLATKEARKELTLLNKQLEQLQVLISELKSYNKKYNIYLKKYL